MGRIEIPQPSSIMLSASVLSSSRKHGRHQAVKRREFITMLGGAAAAWPLASRAQQLGRTRRLGILMALTEDDTEAQPRVSALKERLEQLGWIDGKNLLMEFRWAG